MPATPVNIVADMKAVQYTGSNSSDIAALVTNTSTVTETGGVWAVESPSESTVWTVPTNSWVVYTQNAILQIATTTEYNLFYECNVLCPDVSGFATGQMVRAAGVAPVPLLTVLAPTATVAVQIQPAMPDSSYDVYANKFAGISLTDLQINSVTVVDADTVNVAVENIGIATIAGASVMVHAVA